MKFNEYYSQKLKEEYYGGNGDSVQKTKEYWDDYYAKKRLALDETL